MPANSNIILQTIKALIRMFQRSLAFCSILITLVLFIDKAFAQVTAQKHKVNLVTRFHFKQLYGGVILIRARFGDYPDSLNFILDTGSGGISLDSATAAGLNIEIVPSDVTINGIGGHTKAGFIYKQELKLPGLTIDSLDFHVTDYELLTSFYGEKINGIIGYPVLKKYIVDLDYDSSLISFYSEGAIRYPRGGYLLKPLMRFQPFQHASLKDNREIQSNFIFDIGANICLMLSADFENDSTAIKKTRKRFTKQAEGVGGKIMMQATVVREFKLGPYKFMNVPVCIFEDSDNVTDYPFAGGIIGNDLLRRFNIILNYSNKEIFLKPNSHFNDPFDYVYTGIDLFNLKGENVIGSITAGSPAETTGLKEGDVVLSINNMVSKSLSDLKDALMKSTGNVRIIVIRAGELMEFHFKIKSIM